jgi:hypothetical protein
MKLRLEIDESKYPDLRRELLHMGIEFTEDAPLLLPCRITPSICMIPLDSFLTSISWMYMKRRKSSKKEGSLQNANCLYFID